MSKKSGFVRFLEPRVRKALEENPVILSLDDLVTELQLKNPEFKRKNKASFRTAVNYAWENVLDSGTPTPILTPAQTPPSSSTKAGGKVAAADRTHSSASQPSSDMDSIDSFAVADTDGGEVPPPKKPRQQQAPTASAPQRSKGSDNTIEGRDGLARSSGSNQTPSTATARRGINATHHHGTATARERRASAKSVSAPPTPGRRASGSLPSSNTSNSSGQRQMQGRRGSQNHNSADGEDFFATEGTAMHAGNAGKTLQRRGSDADAFLESLARDGGDEHGTGTVTPGTGRTSRQGKSKKQKKSVARELIDSINSLSADPSPSQREKKLFTVCTSALTLDDMAGLGDAHKTITRIFTAIFRHAKMFSHIGTDPPKGILLHGPPGCGKTMLAHAIAGHWQIPLLKVAAPELIGGASGDSEQYLRDLFDQAELVAMKEKKGCIIFIDEIDIIAGKRETAQREMERRVVSQLSSCMDGLRKEALRESPIIVIGATSRPDSLDNAIRRNERFSDEIPLKVPDLEAREHILRVLLASVKRSPAVDVVDLANRTPGYVGADLRALVNEAGLTAILRAEEQGIKLPEEEVGENGHEDEERQEGENGLVGKGNAGQRKQGEAKKEGEPFVGSDSTHAAVDDSEDDSEDDRSDPSGNDGSEFVNGSKRGQLMARLTSKLTAIKEVEGEASNGLQEEASEESMARNGNTADESVDISEEETAHSLVKAALDITMADFDIALKRVQPSATREGFATIPNVSWEDVGALAAPKSELEEAIVYPLTYPEECRRVGITKPPGVLLYGPPGCGKTLLAKALANSVNANFISVKGPELMNKYVGESERAVRSVFTRARTSSPCVVFFDELDAMCPKRGDSSSRVSERLVNQFLTELDGFDSGREQLFVIGATNRPDIIDPAMLRPGRLEKLVYVDLPSTQARLEILRTHARKVELAPSVDLGAITQDERCMGYSGADVAALLREAGTAAIRRVLKGSVKGSPVIAPEDFEVALNKVKASVSARDLKRYRKVAQEIRGEAYPSSEAGQ